MELYLEPNWIKKDTRFRKGHEPWNAGRKGFTTDNPQKRKKALMNLAEGRKLRHVNGTPSGGRKKVAVCAYGLDGVFVRVFSSIGEAATTLCLPRENVRACVANKRKRSGQYQFRKADVVEFNGCKLVKKSPIVPYKRDGRKRNGKIEEGGIQ